MNIVIACHANSSKPLLFSVPEGVELKDGEMILVQTRLGESAASCLCKSFCLDEGPLKVVAKRFGAGLPLKPVIGRYKCVRWVWEE